MAAVPPNTHVRHALISASKKAATNINRRFSLRLLLALPLAVAIWITVHYLPSYLLILVSEAVLLLGYTSALMSTVVFGKRRSRAFALGAVVSPVAFFQFAMFHSPLNGLALPIVSGDHFSAVIINLYGEVWWIMLWLPVSLLLGCVSLYTQTCLVNPNQDQQQISIDDGGTTP